MECIETLINTPFGFTAALIKQPTMAEYIRDEVIKGVYFDEPYTIIDWVDGTKTVVQCKENDVYDKEKGFALALIKGLICENKSDFYKIFKKHVPFSKSAPVSK